MKCKVDFVPVKMRLPLKFGSETVDSIKIASVTLENYGATGRGETPLSVGWAWPGNLSFAYREEMMCKFCTFLADNLEYSSEKHPMVTGYQVISEKLSNWLDEFNKKNNCEMPYLAALISLSAFDIALHDAYAVAKNVPVYEIYSRKFMPCDLEYFYCDPAFSGKYPEDYFVKAVPGTLTVWHLVGGKDLLTDAELTGNEPDDGYPVTLTEWIKRDGITALKVKLTGVDRKFDYERMVNVGKIALEYGCTAISYDFNCMVTDPEYVNSLVDELSEKEPEISALLLYVEQPFPSEIEKYLVDVSSVSERKPLFMDESAHDWQHVKLGLSLGWNGVALKVCKTQTGALLSGIWAKEHGMQLMVQDLTNPRLAMMPHTLLAANIGTICGVECNAPQFYPAESNDYEKQHPGLYERRNGVVVIESLKDQPGFGYKSEY
ncbi:MAG: mandelate racemase/muconate lactonizing enzyme family protein [Lentisphaeria bacterium]|nr:mandelate racemase/muconate lactonizing enzyme family protein [Lentisphaeria bacterium]